MKPIARHSTLLYQEFSLEEVADLMGQNMNTLKVRIHRAANARGCTAENIKEEALTL